MPMQSDSIKTYKNFGMDTDSSPESVAPEDTRENYNVRGSGTSKGEDGYVTNIESTMLVNEVGSPPNGINKAIGGKEFVSIKKGISFRYNSAGQNQILLYDYVTDTVKAIYTDVVNSAGAKLLSLDPQFYVNCVLLNNTYLVWVDGNSSVGYTNLNTLMSGGYGTVLAEDLSLIKPQNLIPITGTYIDDAGKASNFVKGKLFQFTSRYLNDDFNYSTWGTWSKRIIPQQESTPAIGTTVSQNNCIVVSVNIGSIRAKQLDVACRYGLFDFNIIKTVDRSYITSLPNTAVDISIEVYEAYDPTTNIYSFCFYNESINIPVPPTETDQFVDYIPHSANAVEVVNTNIIALGDLQVGFERPTTGVTISAIGYDPNLTIPNNANPDPLRVSYTFPGAVGSGLGNHRRYIQVNYLGIPKTNDVFTIVLYDIRNSGSTLTYTYTVPSADEGHLLDSVGHFSVNIPDSSYRQDDVSPQVVLGIAGPPYFQLQSAIITLFNAGASISKSIHAVLDNSSYQLALEYRDKYGRPFPIETGNTFIVSTPSFAQLMGQAVGISWTINTLLAPVGSYDYQWLITKNSTVTNLLDVFGNLIDYKGGWDAHTNSPALAANSGTIGDAYQITAPNLPADTPQVNLGNGAVQFNTGDYVIYNGKSWDIVPKTFADLASGNVLAIKINPLGLFNDRYSNNGVNTVLNYDFVVGDRCTMHYYIDPASPTIKNYLSDPTIDVDVFGYDPATFLLKVQKSQSLDAVPLNGKNIFLRLYTPNTQQSGSEVTTDNTTVWYEVGERFTITNGNHDTLQGTITDGDVYFKTRSYSGAIDPNVNYDILATDFNFSDFYASNFTSYGRPRTFYDVLEKTERKAAIIHSEKYVLGSRNNGLNRFYEENVYGDGDGETSSSYGAIQNLWQRGNRLVVIQETNTGYIPVFQSEIEDQIQQRQVAISEKLFNTIIYNQTGDIGCGTLKESFCYYDNLGWFIDPNRSAPVQIGLNGLEDISRKMSKYFKDTLQQAYSKGLKIVMYYDVFYKEVVLCIQTEGDVLTFLPFSETSWEILDDYNITYADILSISNGSHSTVFDSHDGIVVYMPTTDYVGNDTATFSFDVDGNTIVKNICLTWIEGDSEVSLFSFNPLYNQPLSTVISSNTILVQGINVPVPISIVGGEYSVNGGAWVSSAGTVFNNDTVQVRQTSSASNNTTTTATLTISGTSADFNVRTLLAPTTIGILVIDVFDNPDLNISGFCDTPGVAPYRGLVYTGNNFNPGVTTPAADNWALASDLVSGAGSLDWRFEFNLTKLLNMYPAVTSFVFKIKGRGISPTTMDGAYSLKSASDGQMQMAGSPGSYVPGITGTSIGSPIPYSGYAVVGGANGTYGYAIGADILTFNYDVATNVLTLT